eukprot:g20817.t1
MERLEKIRGMLSNILTTVTGGLQTAQRALLAKQLPSTREIFSSAAPGGTAEATRNRAAERRSFEFDEELDKAVFKATKAQKETQSWLAPQEQVVQKAKARLAAATMSSNIQYQVEQPSVGAINPSNWCWMNSIAQALFFAPPFLSQMQQHCLGGGETGNTLCAMVREYWTASSTQNFLEKNREAKTRAFLEALWDKTTALSPLRERGAFPKVPENQRDFSKRLAIDTQQDAGEGAARLLDRDCYLPTDAFSVLELRTTVVHRPLASAANAVETPDPAAPTSHRVTFAEAGLNLAILTDPMSMDKLLYIGLNRFNPNGEKLKNHVDIPETLHFEVDDTSDEKSMLVRNISGGDDRIATSQDSSQEYLSYAASKPPPMARGRGQGSRAAATKTEKYELHSIVLHSGGTVHAGHYTALVRVPRSQNHRDCGDLGRNSEGCWMLFDDSKPPVPELPFGGNLNEFLQ